MRYICTSIVATLALVGTSFAATINVPGDHATIQGAINASSNGDTIAIAAGTYNEHSLNPGGKAITIGSASGNLDVTIDAQQGGRVFLIESSEGDDAVIMDLVITGGSSSYGGGIYCYYSNPTISNCTIEGNTAGSGGGILCDNSNPTISGCTIEGNWAQTGGGIFCYYSNPTINGCTIEGNTVYGDGGGILCDNSNPTISGSQICWNYPDQIHGSYTASGSCIEESCDTCDGDSDADGVPDYLDQCPGEDDTIDTDSDGTPDCLDGCPDDPLKTEPGDCGCGELETDTDSDGTPDCIDGCPDDPLKTEPGDCGCGIEDTNVHGDLNCDGVYDIDDIYAGMEHFGIDEAGQCAGDTDGNGVVNIEDLLNMLGSWGACP